MHKHENDSSSQSNPEGGEVQKFPRLEMAGDSRASLKHPERNEDNYFLYEKGVVGVFDGVGGTEKGELAALIATKAVKEFFEAELMRREASTKEDAEYLVYSALHEANSEILSERSRQSINAQTTGVVAFSWMDDKGELYFTIGHVGDSRACLYSEGEEDGELKQLTLDDSEVFEDMIEGNARRLQLEMSNVTDLKGLSEEEKDLFENRHRLSSSLGSFNKIEPHITTISVQKGDRLLLASDGVTDNLTHEQIRRTLGIYKNNEQAVGELIGNALEISRSYSNLRAKPDDMTAVIVQVGEGQAERLEPSPEELADEFSWWNMSQKLRRGDNYERVNLPGEWYITRVNPDENVVVLTSTRAYEDYERKVTREELKEMMNSDSSTTKGNVDTVVFALEEEASSSS